MLGCRRRILRQSTTATGEEVTIYRKGSYHLIPPEHTIGRKIAVRSYLDRNRTELSNRTYLPQRAWFEAYTPKTFERPHERRRYDFFVLETKLIWKVFDTPEMVGVFLFDEVLKGNTQVMSDEFLRAAQHWTREARYWRCLGITKPFFDKTTLRVHCWEDRGTQVGTLVLSQAMRHALMDLERAVRRREQGLEPNYLWDKWGPAGFIDGARTDYLPRFVHNPYVDPDGVEVTEIDILPMNTHEQIRERYAEFIFPDLSPFDGVMQSVSNGDTQLSDIPDEEVVNFFHQTQQREHPSYNPDLRMELSPLDIRALFFLCADRSMLQRFDDHTKWGQVLSELMPMMEKHNPMIDAARLLLNTRVSKAATRRFFEEKCGFTDFNHTPDFRITAAVLCYLQELHRIVCETDYGSALAFAKTDAERFELMGQTAFRVFRLIEDAALEHRRRVWANRFSADTNEESTLDYLLENFGKRTERARNVGTTGTEFDREQEPIGRQVQRRVVAADKSNRLAEVRRAKGRVRSSRRRVFEALHSKQTQNFSYGLR